MSSSQCGAFEGFGFFKAIEAGLNGLEQGQSLLNIRVSPSSGKFKTPDKYYDWEVNRAKYLTTLRKNDLLLFESKVPCGPSMMSWVDPHPFIESIHTLLRRRVWINSRRHWWSTLYELWISIGFSKPIFGFDHD